LRRRFSVYPKENAIELGVENQGDKIEAGDAPRQKENHSSNERYSPTRVHFLIICMVGCPNGSELGRIRDRS
jgi:hypothetical protein